MSKVAVVAKLTAKDGQRSELVKAFDGMFDAVEAEPETEIYVLHEDAGDPNVVWFFELYADQDALSAHSTSDAMKAAGPVLGGLLAGRPEIFLMHPVRAKGVAVDEGLSDL